MDTPEKVKADRTFQIIYIDYIRPLPMSENKPMHAPIVDTGSGIKLP